MPIEPAPPSLDARRGYPNSCRASVWVLLFLVLLQPHKTLAQNEQGVAPENPERAQPNRRLGGNQPLRRAQAGGFFKRLRELPPAQQQRIMENGPVFRRLSPERQELIRERLREWNSKTPQQKEAIRQREEIFDGLSPAQRQEARTIFPQWRDLSPPRRQALMVAFRHLRDLPPDQRRAFLDSQRVREQFSPHERDILEGMNNLLPASREATPNDPDQ